MVWYCILTICTTSASKSQVARLLDALTSDLSTPETIRVFLVSLFFACGVVTIPLLSAGPDFLLSVHTSSIRPHAVLKRWRRTVFGYLLSSPARFLWSSLGIQRAALVQTRVASSWRCSSLWCGALLLGMGASKSFHGGFWKCKALRLGIWATKWTAGFEVGFWGLVGLLDRDRSRRNVKLRE